MIVLHVGVGLKIHFGSLTKTLTSTTYPSKNFTCSPNCRDLAALARQFPGRNGDFTQKKVPYLDLRVQ